jgi:HSP20 family molecular chaperone IbpA
MTLSLYAGAAGYFNPMMGMPMMRMAEFGAPPQRLTPPFSPFDMLGGRPPFGGEEEKPQIRVRVMRLGGDDDDDRAPESPLAQLMGMSHREEAPESPLSHLMDLAREERPEPENPFLRLLINKPVEGPISRIVRDEESPLVRMLRIRREQEQEEAEEEEEQQPEEPEEEEEEEEPHHPMPMVRIIKLGGAGDAPHPPMLLRSLVSHPGSPLGGLMGVGHGPLPGLPPFLSQGNPLAKLMGGLLSGALKPGAASGGGVTVTRSPNGMTIVRRFSLPVHDEEDDEGEDEGDEKTPARKSPLHFMFRAAHEGPHPPQPIMRMMQLMKGLREAHEHEAADAHPAADAHARAVKLAQLEAPKKAAATAAAALAKKAVESHAQEAAAAEAAAAAKRKIHSAMTHMKGMLHALFTAKEQAEVKKLSAALYTASDEMRALAQANATKAALSPSLEARLEKFLTEVHRGLRGVERTLHLAQLPERYEVVGNYTGLHKSQLSVDLHEQKLTVTVLNNETASMVEHGAQAMANGTHVEHEPAPTYTIGLPKDIAPTRMKASLHNGTLTIVVPRVKDTQVAVSED